MHTACCCSLRTYVPGVSVCRYTITICYYHCCNLSPTQIPSTLSSKRGYIYGRQQFEHRHSGWQDREVSRQDTYCFRLLCTHVISHPKEYAKNSTEYGGEGVSCFVVTETNSSSAAVQCSPTKGDLSTRILVNKCQTVWLPHLVTKKRAAKVRGATRPPALCFQGSAPLV